MTEITLSLTEKELEYLSAATCEFFHKMRSAADNPLVPDLEGRIDVAKSLWMKVEKHAKINDLGV